MLTFNDGVSIPTSGNLRPYRARDGWYVVGGGCCIPVEDAAEARHTIESMARDWVIVTDLPGSYAVRTCELPLGHGYRTRPEAEHRIEVLRARWEDEYEGDFPRVTIEPRL
mgnify:CR=1 FL=1|jgi:hypothetical protein